MSDGSGIFHTNAEGVFMSLELQSAMLLLVSLGLQFLNVILKYSFSEEDFYDRKRSKRW
jgi:hypothetical protein